MATSATVRAIRAASKEVADLGLRRVGFRRMGTHLHRTTDDLIQAVHFQGSQFGSATSGSFTVNLVVTSPFLYTTWTGRDFPRNPATTLFPVRSRIGALMSSRSDHWWQADEKTDLSALSREVSDAILEYGLPFLDSFQSTASLLERLREGGSLPGLTEPQQPLVHAMLAVKTGDREEAKRVLRAAYVDAAGSPFGGTVRSIAMRLGFEVV